MNKPPSKTKKELDNGFVIELAKGENQLYVLSFAGQEVERDAGKFHSVTISLIEANKDMKELANSRLHQEVPGNFYQLTLFSVKFWI